MRVGWLTATADAKLASYRYRCLHAARGLAAVGVENVVYQRAKHLIADLSQLDAVVVVVKLLRSEVVDLAAAADDLGIPVFLDLCDDILGLEYRRSLRLLNRAVFRAIAPTVQTVVVSSEALADRLRDHGYGSMSMTVIPDIAEDADALTATLAFAKSIPGATPAANETDATAPAFEPPFAAAPGAAPRERTAAWAKRPGRVVWFGNHGVPHSNFGMLSLLSVARDLARLYDRVPFELVVVSDHEAKFETFLVHLGVPVRFVRWTQTAAHQALADADVALLTSGDDRFSKVKSSNRTLQALAAGIPVVATPSLALDDLGEAVWCGAVAEGLELYLTDPAKAQEAVAKGRRLIAASYNVEAIGKKWRDVLEGKAPLLPAAAARAEADAPRLLILINRAADVPRLAAIVEAARARGVEAMAITTQMPAADAASIARYFTEAALLPTMATPAELASGDQRWLRSAAAVIVLGVGEAQDALSALASHSKAPVVRLGDEGVSVSGDLPNDLADVLHDAMPFDQNNPPRSATIAAAALF